MAAAGSANDQFEREDNAGALGWKLVARDPFEQEIGCGFSDLIHRLTDHSESRLQNIGNIEVVEAGKGDLSRHIDAKNIQRMQHVAHGQVIAREQSRGRSGGDS